MARTGRGRDGHADRYRDAERILWRHHELEPEERFVAINEGTSRIRVQMVGRGPPLVLVHGGLWPGAVWTALLPHLRQHRCYVVDRPGCGLSEPIDWRGARYLDVVRRTMTSMLDALDLDRPDLAGHSIGGAWVTALAIAHPDRARSIAVLGAAPLLAELRPPPFLRLLASPAGVVLSRLPHSVDRARAILRQDGHGAILDAGRVPEAFFRWHAALTHETRTLVHERAMIRATLGYRGWKDGATMGVTEVASLSQRLTYVIGDNDPEGPAAFAHRIVSLVPSGRVTVVPGGGHVPWLDDAGLAASAMLRGLQYGAAGAVLD